MISGWFMITNTSSVTTRLEGFLQNKCSLTILHTDGHWRLELPEVDVRCNDSHFSIKFETFRSLHSICHTLVHESRKFVECFVASKKSEGEWKNNCHVLSPILGGNSRSCLLPDSPTSLLSKVQNTLCPTASSL